MPQDVLDRILTHTHARKSGQGWMGRCPAHDDRKPSLSIKKENGKILLNCHAGCDVQDICIRLGLDVKQLFDEKKHSGPNGHAEIEAIYDYVDEAGKLLFQKVRYVGKGFYQRRPDGKGGWIDKLGDTRRVLYHLPEILAADTVMVCEGEKDADTGCALGFVATTNTDGSGKGKWKNRPQYADTLKGKNVIIVPDIDESHCGQDRGLEIAMSLVYKAASIRIVNLPVVWPKKDLTDWVQLGGTAEQLRRIIGHTPEWREEDLPDAAGGPTFEMYDPEEFEHAQFGDSSKPLIEGLIERQSRTMIVGKPKMMKSLVAFNIAFEAALGLRVFGRFQPDNMVRTMYCQCEDPRKEVQKRYRKFKASHDGLQPLKGFYKQVIARRLDLMEEASRHKLERALEDFKPQLLVLDVMRSLFAGDINKTDDVRPFLEYLDTICERFGCAIILVHYSAKNEAGPSAAGSTYLDGWPDLIAYVHNKRTLGKATLAQLEFRARAMEHEPLTISYDETHTPILSVIEGSANEYEFETAKKFLNAGFTIKDVAQIFDINYFKARRLIEQWTEEKKVQLTSKPGRGAIKKFDFVWNPEKDLH